MGQSLHNRAPLGIALPPLLFSLLLSHHHPDVVSGGAGTGAGAGPELGLRTLEAFDPAAATSIKNVASLPKDQLRSMLEMEGLPDSTTAEQYVRHAVQDLLVGQVAWQAEALAAGFFSAVDAQLLHAWGLGPEALAVAVGGTAAAGSSGDFDVRKVGGGDGRGCLLALTWATLVASIASSGSSSGAGQSPPYLLADLLTDYSVP